MSPIEQKLAEYQHRVGQLVDQQRQFEVHAREAGQKAELIRQKIAGIREAMEMLAVIPGAQKAVEPMVRRRHRPLSSQWQLMLQRANEVAPFSYSVLESVAEAAGHSVGRETLRSQMSLYRGAGFVKAVGDGMFVLTPSGRKAAGIEPISDGGSPADGVEPPTGNPADGSETARDAQ